MRTARGCRLRYLGDRMQMNNEAIWLMGLLSILVIAGAQRLRRAKPNKPITRKPLTKIIQRDSVRSFISLRDIYLLRRESIDYLVSTYDTWIHDYLASGVAESIRSYRQKEIFKEMKEILELRHTDQKSAIQRARLLTVSGAIYSFKVPTVVYILDDVAEVALLGFLAQKEKLKKKHPGWILDYAASRKFTTFPLILENIPAAKVRLYKAIVDEVPILIQLLSETLSKDVDLEFESLKRSLQAHIGFLPNVMSDDECLRYALTTAYCLLGRDVPETYHQCNDFFYSYLTGAKYYTGNESNNLTVVR